MVIRGTEWVVMKIYWEEERRNKMRELVWLCKLFQEK
jgi:hypothetical protein